jgi:hypothetical protein
LVGEYRSISKCNVDDGSTVLFWKDFWIDFQTFNVKFPRLYSYALAIG